MIPTRSVRLAVVGVSIALFILALCLPSARFLQNPGTPSAYEFNRAGITMLLMSLLGPLSGNFAFCANILLLVGWLMISAQKYRGAAISLFIGFLFTLQTVQMRSTRVIEDEGGVNFSYMTHLLPGWWVWLLSILFPLAAAIYFKWFAPKLPPAPPATPSQD
jgi:hypothetical protein